MEPKKIETMNTEAAVEYLRNCGMSITPDTVRLGIQQGQFPFGTCVVSRNGSPVCTIYAKLLKQWVDERAG